MEEGKLLKVYFHSIRYAVRQRYEQIATDFAAWRVERLLRKLGLRQTTGQAFVDYLREQNGRGENGGTDAMHKVRALTFDPANAVNRQSPVTLNLIRLDPTAKTLKTNQQARVIILLHAKWGLSFKEIGEILGYGEGRVSQVLLEAKRKLGKMEPV